MSSEKKSEVMVTQREALSRMAQNDVGVSTLSLCREMSFLGEYVCGD